MTVVQNEATSSKNAGLGQTRPQKQLAVKVLITILLMTENRCSISFKKKFAVMKTGAEQTRYFTLNHVQILIILNLLIIHGRNHYANA